MPPVRMTYSVNPSIEDALSIEQAVQFNNKALQLSKAGDFTGAERLHLRAIKLKEGARALGCNHIKTAVSYNAIGELYINMGDLDKAEEYLKKAIAI